MGVSPSIAPTSHAPGDELSSKFQIWSHQRLMAATMESAESHPPPQAAIPAPIQEPIPAPVPAPIPAPNDVPTDAPQTQPAEIEPMDLEQPMDGETSHRRRGRELDTQTRIQILTLKDIAGWSYGQIHRHFPHIPRSTITTTCRRNHPVTLQRSGRPKTLTDDDRTMILRMVKEDPHIPYNDLLAAVDNKCSKTSISRLLRQDGINIMRLREKTKPSPRKSTGSPATIASPLGPSTSEQPATPTPPDAPRHT